MGAVLLDALCIRTIGGTRDADGGAARAPIMRSAGPGWKPVLASMSFSRARFGAKVVEEAAGADEPDRGDGRVPANT